MLTFKQPSKNAEDDTFIFFTSIFRKKNKTWCFMWILCLAEDWHEISSLTFSKKKKKKKKKQWKNIQDSHLLQSWLAP